MSAKVFKVRRRFWQVPWEWLWPSVFAWWGWLPWRRAWKGQVRHPVEERQHVDEAGEGCTASGHP